MKIDVLGTKYTILERSEVQDTNLLECDGYCDKTAHLIVIITKSNDCNLADFEVYRRKILRHEIIHAFLFESGLHENWEHVSMGHDETYVDWVAVQFPKLLKAFKVAGCLED